MNYKIRYWYWRIRGNLQTLADIAVVIATSAVIAVLWWLTEGR